MKSPNTFAIGTLLAGVVLGAGTMVSMSNGFRPSQAVAQSPVASFRQTAATTANPSVNEGLATLKNLDASVSSLAQYATEAVVHIMSEGKRSDLFQHQVQVGGQGSGFIYRSDGYIVTNDHVVGGFDKVTVILHDGREFPGKVIRAENNDIAIVKIDAKNLPSLEFADSSQVKPGQFSMAIGSPFGFENSVTIGHVSALERANQIGNRVYPTLIQTDTPINMGNSGGPLINSDGKVIGINTSIYSQNGLGSNGIGFAIPGNQAHLIADKLITKGKLDRPALGLVPEDVKEYRQKELNIDGGVVVRTIINDGPSAKAGIKEGDVLLRINDTTIKDQTGLRDELLKFSPGDQVKLETLRGGNRNVVTVKLGDADAIAAKLAPTPQVPQDPESDGDLDKMRKQFKDQLPDDLDVPGLKGFQDTPNAPRVQRSGPARLGVTLLDVTSDVRSHYSIPPGANGALVVKVEPGSPAWNYGIRTGDLIEEFNGQSVRKSSDVSSRVQAMKWGDKVQMKFSRFSPDGSGTKISSTTIGSVLR
ncbi:MAG: trypsin-like peptidase domain-containing protein [Armatimonadetes bacterium]|nr:trypsin-like peptidase domain-containing protein [Armatimonadota bacterium]